MRTKTIVLTVGLLAIGGVALADTPRHKLPESGDLVVGLCDGETSVTVAGKKAGQSLTREEAKSTSDKLMAEWKKKHPGEGALWEKESRLVAQNDKPAPVAQPGAQPSPSVQHGHTYGAYTTRDEQVWKASTDAFIEQGNKVFHDAQALGGTIGVSCDMCHPNAANTHPETYPKYQVQLGRVALLRDMINWCIENPVRGKPLKDDDPKMKAMEAYILAQRKGVALDYGKH
jgi:thiosulfate dehydrogenase